MLETPLSRAVHNGHLQTARHLLDKGADVNCLDIVRCRLDSLCFCSAPQMVVAMWSPQYVQEDADFAIRHRCMMCRTSACSK